MSARPIGESDFIEALEALGGCSHIPPGKAQRLDTICDKCREGITKLVLLREHYEAAPAFFDGPKER